MVITIVVIFVSMDSCELPGKHRNLTTSCARSKGRATQDLVSTSRSRRRRSSGGGSGGRSGSGSGSIRRGNSHNRKPEQLDFSLEPNIKPKGDLVGSQDMGLQYSPNLGKPPCV